MSKGHQKRKMINSARIFFVGLAATILFVVYGFILMPHLPAKVPTHWNAAGKADQFSTPSEAIWLGVFLILGVAVLFAVIPYFAPKNKPLTAFADVYEKITYGIIGFMVVINVLILQSSLMKVDVAKIICIFVCGLFIFLGNLMGKTTRNYYVGIRTPWTLESDVVWERTHRLAARTMVAFAIAAIILILIGLNPVIGIFVATAGILIPVPYSYFLAKKLGTV